MPPPGWRPSAGCRALEELVIEGPATNTDLLHQILHHPDFVRGNYSTGFLEAHMDTLLAWSGSGRCVRYEQRLCTAPPEALPLLRAPPRPAHTEEACPACGKAVPRRELVGHRYVCPLCGHHYPVGPITA